MKSKTKIKQGNFCPLKTKQHVCFRCLLFFFWWWWGSVSEKGTFCLFLSVVTLSALAPALASTAGISSHSSRCCPGNSEGQLLREKALGKVCRDPGDKVKKLEQSQIKSTKEKEDRVNSVFWNVPTRSPPSVYCLLGRLLGLLLHTHPWLGLEELNRSHPLLLA